MNQWVQQIYQWMQLHPADTAVLGLAGTLVTLLGVFWKSVWSFVSFCWAWIRRALSSGRPEPRPLPPDDTDLMTLHFAGFQRRTPNF
jgi:hypothetical protein